MRLPTRLGNRSEGNDNLWGYLKQLGQSFPAELGISSLPHLLHRISVAKERSMGSLGAVYLSVPTTEHCCTTVSTLRWMEKHCP